MSAPALFTGLCDDAAIFPPGNLPLEEAVPAHLAHRAAAHAGLVGPFVLAAGRLDDLAPLVAALPAGSFEVALVVAGIDALPGVLAVADALPPVRVSGVEVTLPEDATPDAVVPGLQRGLAGRAEVTAYVELPRDERRPALVAALAGTPYLAKLRTGGVRADLYPDERELAEAVVATARVELPVKATAGLHHAVRNTDPATGVEQHGFLNVLAAVDVAQQGADVDAVAAVLAERDGRSLADLLRAGEERAESVRRQFRSFGTCSISEPVADLVALGLLDLASLRPSPQPVPQPLPQSAEGTTR